MGGAFRDGCRCLRCRCRYRPLQPWHHCRCCCLHLLFWSLRTSLLVAVVVVVVAVVWYACPFCAGRVVRVVEVLWVLNLGRFLFCRCRACWRCLFLLVGVVGVFFVGGSHLG